MRNKNVLLRDILAKVYWVIKDFCNMDKEELNKSYNKLSECLEVSYKEADTYYYKNKVVEMQQLLSTEYLKYRELKKDE